MIITKDAGGPWRLLRTTCVPPDKVNARPQVTAAMVRARAVRLIPSAAIGLAPHTATLVNIQTIMWVDAQARQHLPPVQILGRRVTITIGLASVQWSFGDGRSAQSRDAGKAYDPVGAPCQSRLCPGHFGHEYAHTGDVRVQATGQYAATFTVDGGQPVAIPGLIAGPTAVADLQVKQARGVLVPNPTN